MRKISCINENNIRLDFADTFRPWLLENCEGIYEVKNTVTTSANTMTDGSTYQGSTTTMRNIILTLRDHPDADHASNRSILYSLFKPKSPGTLTYSENGNVRKIEYYVESVIIDSAPRSRRATVSLLCPDPFFTDPEDVSVQMAGWVAGFEWPHMFTQSDTFGNRTEEQLRTIDNTSAAEHIGITITIEATGQVITPTITLIEQGEKITVGTTDNPMEMAVGDKIVITTHTNNKHAYLISDGETTDINEYLAEDSEFLQIMSGENTFGYSAVSGEEYMSVSISFRYRYAGV